MSKYIGTAFPDSPSVGDDFYNTKEKLYYRFQGGSPADPLNWIIFDGMVEADPSTVGWGNNQRGAHWFNVTDMNWKGFNGTEIVLIG